MGNHATLALIFVKTETSGAYNRSRLKNTAFADFYMGVNSHGRFQDAVRAQFRAGHHHAVGADTATFTDFALHHRRGVNPGRIRNRMCGTVHTIGIFHAISPIASKALQEFHYGMVRIFHRH